MRSHQYVIPLKYQQKKICLRVYADRSVESGYLEPEFVSTAGEATHARDYVAKVLQMAREFDKTITKEYL